MAALALGFSLLSRLRTPTLSVSQTAEYALRAVVWLAPEPGAPHGARRPTLPAAPAAGRVERVDREAVPDDNHRRPAPQGPVGEASVRDLGRNDSLGGLLKRIDSLTLSAASP